MVPAHPGLRTLFVHSLADEHVPKRINVTILADRFVRAVGEDDAEALLLHETNHDISSPQGAEELFITETSRFLQRSLHTRSCGGVREFDDWSGRGARRLSAGSSGCHLAARSGAASARWGCTWAHGSREHSTRGRRASTER